MNRLRAVIWKLLDPVIDRIACRVAGKIEGLLCAREIEEQGGYDFTVELPRDGKFCTLKNGPETKQ